MLHLLVDSTPYVIRLECIVICFQISIFEPLKTVGDRRGNQVYAL